MNQFILGVDPGTVVTGYGIVKTTPQGLVLVDFGCIRPPAKLKLSERYLIIHQAIEKLIEIHAPQAMAIETQFVHKNPASAIKLGMARGVIVLAASKNNIDIFEYSPKKAKLAVTGSGNASKHQVQSMVQLQFRLNKPPEPEDAADALALAICHAHAKETAQTLGVLL